MIPLNEGQIKGKITKGEVKCNEKYRFKVALLIENRNTTFAPQYDIWPRGRTHAINAAAIETNKIIYIPILHILFNLHQL